MKLPMHGSPPQFAIGAAYGASTEQIWKSRQSQRTVNLRRAAEPPGILDGSQGF
ncbi:hypothetical protein NSU_1535 [Novosphingobium pentaromativorans US6-1]|uniref:Uncharacterized protein n=1 Tax=Novosphingobium pentaromativorans US6-1 TaxID=1088721 RepID=G6EB14_9SPHN|nr:hypothetical protein NSU_1535 [Novosphingobium pentaromativorans US6-1]